MRIYEKYAVLGLGLLAAMNMPLLAADSAASRPAVAAHATPASVLPPDVAGKPQARLVLGSPAPEIAAMTLEGKEAALAGLHGDHAAHPNLIVLQFGSITDPLFRARVPAVEKLADRYADTVTFVVLYQQEAHAADSPAAIEMNNADGFNIAQPLSMGERQKLAQQAVDRLKIVHQTVLVDAWNNTTSLRYGSYPNMTFIVDGKGILQAGYPWMDPAKVQAALDDLLLGKPLPPELKGSIKLSASAPLDYSEAAMEMTGGRGPGTIAVALDKLNLTDQQRMTLYPALAQFLADLQAFRQTRQAMPGAARGSRGARGGAAGGGARGAAPGGAQSGTTPKVSTPEEMQAANDALHASAAKLSGIIRQTVNAKDAAALFEALESTQQQRLFANP